MTDDGHLIIEPIGEQSYLLRLSEGGDVVEIVLYLDAATVAAIAPDDVGDRRIAQETIAFLTEHQRADDLPERLDLADVAAAYTGWVGEMRTRLQRASPAPE